MTDYNQIVGIDPGPFDCAGVVVGGGRVSILVPDVWKWAGPCERILIAYEQFAATGQSVADESYRTIWTCRGFVDHLGFRLASELNCDVHVLGITRRQVKSYLVGTQACGDPQVRDAIICRYGGTKAAAIGRKGNPGPLYGIVGHHWAALAVAITASDPVERERAAVRSWAPAIG